MMMIIDLLDQICFYVLFCFVTCISSPFSISWVWYVCDTVGFSGYYTKFIYIFSCVYSFSSSHNDFFPVAQENESITHTS